MSQPTLESLAQQAAAGDRAASDVFLTRLRTILRTLDAGTLAEVARCALALKEQGADETPLPVQPGQVPPAMAAPVTPRPRVVPLTPELLEWARQQFTEEELAASLRELRANGGLSSEEVLSVLDDEVGHP
jgi:hypothetical protein